MRQHVAVRAAISLALASACEEKRVLDPTRTSPPQDSTDTSKPAALQADSGSSEIVDAGAVAQQAGTIRSADAAQCQLSEFGSTCENTLGQAPEHLPNRQPRGGLFVPSSVQCIVVLEAAVPYRASETIHNQRTSKEVPYTNADAHPKRVAARYGKCSAAFEGRVKENLRSAPLEPALLIEHSGDPMRATQLRSALLPIDSPEKLALYLEVAPFPASFWLNKSGGLFERKSSSEPKDAKGTCFGCKDYEFLQLPTGEFEVIGLSTQVLESAGCHTKTATYRTVFRVSPDGKATPVARTQIAVRSPFCVGRAPEGYEASSAVHSLASYFEHLARDERASIASFERLANELAQFGAPDVLVERARHAAREEERHAIAMQSLAEPDAEFVPEICKKELLSRKSLFEVAKENFVEGCIGETFAAAVAAHQAIRATDDEVCSAMKEIAEEESSHAVLAHDVHDWFETRLTAKERRAVRHAGRKRIEELWTAYEVEPAPWRIVAGEPGSDASRAMLATLRATLWDM